MSTSAESSLFPAAPFTVPRIRGRIDAVWPVPGSKSITNRALVLAALAEGDSELSNVLVADDTTYMRAGLTALGIGIRDAGPGRLIVSGGRSRLRPASAPIAVGNSGTTVRFLAALAALVPGDTTLIGDAHMQKRPIADLVDGLRQLGIDVTCATGCPPLTIHGGRRNGRIHGGAVRMRGDKSSQYFTALLLVAGLADGDLDIGIDGPLVSKPYVTMTRRMVTDFGGSIDALHDGFRVRCHTGFHARSYAIEPDASAASYPFALAAAGGHRITVPGLTKDSLQGDYGFVDVLRQVGADIASDAAGTTVNGTLTQSGVDVDLHHLSDTVMSLAAIAPLLRGKTRIRNVANIRIKETDRLLATVTELRRLGQTVEHGDDWLDITPTPLRSATVQCYADHRMAMSFAILGCLAPADCSIAIADPACTAKTYPTFWQHLAAVAAAARA